MTNFLLTPYDPRTGRYGSISKGASGRGGTRPLYINHPAYDEEEEEELDMYVDEMSDEILAKIEKRLGMNYSGGTDSSRSDNAYLVGNNSILEFSGDHTTPTPKGLSPRLSYRSKGNSKGPALGAQGSAMYIRNKPGSISGTQYGTSRAHKILTDIEDDGIDRLQDLPDPMERAFLRHQNRVKKTLNLIKECLSTEDI
jgi:hypothetical protein